MSATTHVDQPHIRQRLEALRGELLQRERRVHHHLTRQDQALSADYAEQAVEVQNDATLYAIGSAARAELAEIDAALRRVDSGKYGLCRDCGKPIAPLRLATLPQAVRCSECAR